MKVQILQLDAHEDLASARDKLAWAQAQRVVLVWPDRARVLRKKLDLVLIRRQAARQGCELGLVTRDPVVLEHAAELGIPVFRSTTRMPEEFWKTAAAPPISPPPRPGAREAVVRPLRDQPHPIPAWLRTTMIGLLVLVLAGAVLALAPSSTITISPAQREQQADILLTLDPRAETADADGHIPARLETLRLTGEIRVTTTGKTQVPGHPASGEVIFSNLTDESILVPAGTGVLPAGRPDLRFATVADLELPPGKAASARVGVVAARPGLAGNLPPDSLDAIDGPLGLRATVAQPDRLTGGTEIERGAVAPADHATALRLLTEQILADASSKIDDGLEPGEALAPASLRVVRTPRRSYDREIGATADSVHLDLTLELTAFVYRTEDLQVAAGLALSGRLPSSATAVPGSLAWTIREADPSRPEVLLVNANQQVYAPIPASTVRRLVRGMPPSEASARLAALPGQAQPAEIESAPTWWPFLPWLEVRIRVRMPWEPL
jgi:hypothetical protein